MDKIRLAQLCRICLANGAGIPIFEENKDKPCNILSKLALCLKEKIEDLDGYPQYICNLCNNILDTICDFINKYKSTCRILEKGLEDIKQESDDLSSLSEKCISEEEIEIENIKNEYVQSSDNEFDIEIDDDENFRPVPLDIQVKLEDDIPIKASTKKSFRLGTSTKQITNNIATSILEGQFAWDGSKWCCSSKSKNILQNKRLLKPKTDKKVTKRITIKIPKIKKPNPPKLCDLCGEVFKSTDKLTVHKKKVHFRSPVKCPHCLRIFVSNYYLKRHIKRKHEEHKTFICAICGRGFAFKGELSSHNRKVHDKDQLPKKQFKCQFCNKIYKCAKSVTVHERSAHTGDRPAVCSVCGSSFYHEDYLKEHMRLHTGETPFKCPICGRGYAQRGNMKSHLRIHKRSELDATTLSKLRPNYLKLLKA